MKFSSIFLLFLSYLMLANASS